MSDIWILEHEDTYNGETNRYMYATSGAAYREAAYDILNRIRENWDLEAGSSQRALAEEINTHVLSAEYRKALEIFNDEEGDSNKSFFITVSSTDMMTYADTHEPELIEFEDEDFDDEEEDEDEEEDDSPYLASSPGAVCRGPCKNHSTDAYADKRDGTYECYSCKLMKSVFGS